MKNLILIMGKTASGKSTLEKGLCEKYPKKYKRIISSTTRDMRSGEVANKTYYFITKDEFKKQELNNEFLQVTHYDNNYYASHKDEYFSKKENTILVVTPAQAQNLKNKFQKEYPEVTVLMIYFDITNEKILENIIKRGDDPKKIEERLKNDKLKEEFESLNMYADITVKDDLLDDKLTDYVDKKIESKTRVQFYPQ